MITAAPPICLTASVGCGSVSRKELARRIGERNEVDNCGFGVAQRPEYYHTQHRQLELKMTKLRGDIDFERSDAPMCRVRIATLWNGGHVNVTAVRIFMQLGNGSSIFRLDTFCLMRSGPTFWPGATCESTQTVGNGAHHVL